jgi:hypothetical protein
MTTRITISVADGVHDCLEKAAERLGKQTATLGRELMEERMRELGMMNKTLAERDK